MRSFLNILKFELDNYFKSKSYVISTILIAVICAVIMCVPRFVSNDDKKDDNDKTTEASIEDIDTSNVSADELILVCDTNGIVDKELLAGYLDIKKIKFVDSADEVKKLVKEQKAKEGYIVNSVNDYDYVIFNSEIFADGPAAFSEFLSVSNKMLFCDKYGIDKAEFLNLEYAEVNVNEIVLGKDGSANYFYCYILIIIVFMLIVMYGMTIATGVTNEKSNRSIEILVTSTNSTTLLFGKVFAGAIATVFQVGIIGSSLLGSYNLNKDYWKIDISQFFDIPGSVIISFAIFGLGGFLFYAFMYGALGALVSKIEDLNKSAGTAQMLVMIVYIITLLQLSNIDGVVMKVCSYLPISSYSAMFARVAMGSVATWEIVVSAVILYASVVLMGIVGGKIFRASTLRYGNPIKLSNALKSLKKSE